MYRPGFQTLRAPPPNRILVIERGGTRRQEAQIAIFKARPRSSFCNAGFHVQKLARNVEGPDLAGRGDMSDAHAPAVIWEIAIADGARLKAFLLPLASGAAIVWHRDGP